MITGSPGWKDCKKLIHFSRDPGFPRGGGGSPTPKEISLTIFFPKTTWKWKPMDRGGASLAPPWSPKAFITVFMCLFTEHFVIYFQGTLSFFRRNSSMRTSSRISRKTSSSTSTNRTTKGLLRFSLPGLSFLRESKTAPSYFTAFASGKTFNFETGFPPCKMQPCSLNTFSPLTYFLWRFCHSQRKLRSNLFALVCFDQWFGNCDGTNNVLSFGWSVRWTDLVSWFVDW